MFTKINFKKDIFNTDPYNFNEKALQLFKFQSQNNSVYQKFIQHLGRSTSSISTVQQIPFLPIGLFKYHKVVTGNEAVNVQFKSSGTTGQVRSIHHVMDTEFYLQVSKKIFESKYGSLTNYIILALLPSYVQNQDSSLVFMVNGFIEKTSHKYSSFIHTDALSYIAQVYKDRGDRKVLIIGVTYAFLELCTKGPLEIPDAIVMETGGMKGRGEEMPREQVHTIFRQAFGIHEVHSEYGMTELLSQAYSTNDGLFQSPPWMKVFTREISDPLSMNNQQTPGVLNFIDLSNVDSCAFIATEDLGKLNLDGTFTVLGRIDNSETRGCNLLNVS